jgi:hypothetical protein
MDLKNALLLTGSVFGIVELAKALIGKPWNANTRVLVSLVIVVSFGVTFLVAHTAWAHEQVIGDKRLDDLGVASLVLVSILVAGAQTALWAGLKAVTNIGENQPAGPPPPPAPTTLTLNPGAAPTTFVVTTDPITAAGPAAPGIGGTPA